MKFQNTQVMNFQGAFRGLRNPLQSWDKSDSNFKNALSVAGGWFTVPKIEIGQKDLDLAKRMIKAGESDSKFLRQIFVSVDITAPLYWWKEADTYKIATVANSTSTMHKLSSTPITLDCFEVDDMQDFVFNDPSTFFSCSHSEMINTIINYLEYLRNLYNETKDKKYWKQLIRWLPEGWLQTRTWTANYAVLRNMYFQREHHKLTQWHTFCKWVEELPYAKELILYKG